jgi:hypothetical protein
MTNKEKVNKFLKRFSKAKSNWYEKSEIHEEAYDYAMPNRNNFNNTENKSKRNLHLYDNTAVDSLGVFASRLLQMVAPVGKDFFRFKVSKMMEKSFIKDMSMTPEEVKEQQVVLDDITDIFFQFWHDSNAPIKLHESFHDLGIGTCCVSIEESFVKHKPVNYGSIPISELSIEEGVHGIIDNVYRERRVAVGSIERLYAKATLSNKILRRIEVDPTEKVNIVEGVTYNQENDNFDFTVVIKDHSEIIYESSFLSNPYSVARWRVVPGEVYGRGPVIDLLPDIKMLNKASEFYMRGVEKSTSEIYLAVEDGALNSDIGLTIEPDSLLMVEDVNNFQRLPFGGRTDIAQVYIQERQHNIRKKLLADSIDRKKALSPEEINALNNEKLFDTSATFLRLTQELMENTILRTLEILQKTGKIPKSFKFDKEKYSIQYTNPLSQIQNIQDTQLLLTTVSQIDNTLGVNVSDIVLNKPDIATKVALNSNIDAAFIKTKDEQTEQQKAQQQQQQQMMMNEMQKGQK